MYTERMYTCYIFKQKFRVCKFYSSSILPTAANAMRVEAYNKSNDRSATSEANKISKCRLVKETKSLFFCNRLNYVASTLSLPLTE